MQIAGNPQSQLFAMAAEVPNASALYHAAEKVRDAGYTRWDVYSPFPIHGMDHAMGLKKSWLSALVFIGGITGLTIAAILQFYPSSIEYPLVVAGKPTNFFTVPAFFPIMFELTILFSGFTTLFGLLALMKLPRFNHPLFNSKQFDRTTDDGFFIALEARDPKFSANGTRDFLSEIGGASIELIEEEPA
jgi:hypothetical protein